MRIRKSDIGGVRFNPREAHTLNLAAGQRVPLHDSNKIITESMKVIPPPAT